MVKEWKAGNSQTAWREAPLLLPLACSKHPSWDRAVERSNMYMLCLGIKFETGWWSRKANIGVLAILPRYKIIQDIGSGLNWRRPGFLTLLEKIYSGEVAGVAVLDKDRLCRFGFELVGWICKKHATKITVHNQVTSIEDTGEHAGDLLVSSIFLLLVAMGWEQPGTRSRERCKTWLSFVQVNYHL